MARPCKDGRKAEGIRADKGKLYIIVTTNYVDAEGKKHFKHTWVPTHLANTEENVKIARTMREDILRDMHDNNKSAVTTEMTVEEYVNYYLKNYSSSKSDTRYRTEKDDSVYIVRFFGKKKMRAIKREDVDAFYKWLLNQMVNIGKSNEGPISKRYAQDIRKLFKAIMKKAAEKKDIQADPSIGIDFDKAALNKKKRNYPIDETFFDYEEAVHFLEILENEIGDLSDRVSLEWVLYFGLRREEIAGVRWSAISREQRKWRMINTVTRGTQLNFNEDDGKTEASIREYPLNQRQIDQLNALEEKEKYYRAVCKSTYKVNDYVFKCPDGTIHDPGYYNKKLKKIIKGHPELPQRVTLHGLRYSCVSILEHAGWDIKRIQDWVGHEDASTTEKIYARVKSKKAKKETAAKLDDLFFGIFDNGGQKTTNNPEGN